MTVNFKRTKEVIEKFESKEGLSLEEVLGIMSVDICGDINQDSAQKLESLPIEDVTKFVSRFNGLYNLLAKIYVSNSDLFSKRNIEEMPLFAKKTLQNFISEHESIESEIIKKIIDDYKEAMNSAMPKIKEQLDSKIEEANALEKQYMYLNASAKLQAYNCKKMVEHYENKQHELLENIGCLENDINYMDWLTVDSDKSPILDELSNLKNEAKELYHSLGNEISKFKDVLHKLEE